MAINSSFSLVRIQLLLNASAILFIISSFFSLIPSSHGGSALSRAGDSLPHRSGSPSRSNSWRGGTSKRPAPVDPDLMQLSEELYRLDQVNDAARENVHWTVNTRSRTGKLFTKMDETILRTPVYAKLTALFDNYETIMGRAELVTAKERAEQSDFLDEILRSPVMRKAWDFLVSRKLVPSVKADFKEFLNRTWFTVYKRRGQPDTSGFEHIFVGEIDGNGVDAPVSGFHSWVRYYLEEKAGRAVYRRWKGQTEPDVFGLEFTWNNHLKIKSTMAIGESPAMSIAVLTTCFLVVPNGECQLRMGGTPVSVITHRWDTRNPAVFYVASAYYDN